MTRFEIGDCVKDATRSGVIADGFYWKDADDGTQNEPKSGYVAVVWDDGTQGYRHENELEYS